MEHLSSSMEQQLEWRRDKVQELSSQGYSQREIAKILQVGIGTINRDLSYLRQQSKENIKRYIDERLPEEYEKCLVGLTAILREAWSTSQQAEDRREKIQALSLAKECYSMKLDLLTNATVVDDAIRFVSESEKSKDKDKEEQVKSSCPSSSSDSSGNEDDNKESKDPHYNDEEKSDKESEEKQEHDTGEITINQVF
jgi:IS30 family transposase